MSAELVLEAVLGANAGFTTIAGDRIFPDVVPQGEPLPAVAYTRPGTEYVQTIHATSPVGSTATLDVSCVAESRSAADQLAKVVTDALGASGFLILDRQGAFNFESDLWAAIVIVSFNE